MPELTVGTGGAPFYSPASGQPNIVKTYSGYGNAKFSISESTIDTFSISR